MHFTFAQCQPVEWSMCKLRSRALTRDGASGRQTACYGIFSAPNFITFTIIGMSPCPVIEMMGIR